MSLNPLKRVNSILTVHFNRWAEGLRKSQSPQAGQFTSYDEKGQIKSESGFESQSPQAGQFNSY